MTNGIRPPDPPLTTETLKNTSWEREKFRIDLAPDGNVFIGGGKIYWEGQEIGRAK